MTTIGDQNTENKFKSLWGVFPAVCCGVVHLIPIQIKRPNY